MENSTKYLIGLFIILIIIILVYLWAIIPIFEFYYTGQGVTLNLQEPYDLANINKAINEKYPTEIYPQGKANIDYELNKVRQINDSNSKLNEIFRWEMNDWHNPLWEPSNFYGYNKDYTFTFYDRNLSRFKVQSLVETRLFLQKNTNGTLFSEDPYTLAYTKVGSCRELSNLFTFMAEQSGIESRTVSTLWDHQWSEVKINGEWMYFDPWCAVEHGYYNSTDGNLTFENKWFNKIEYFRDNCHGLALINWYNEFPYHWATPVYDISYQEKDLKTIVFRLII